MSDKENGENGCLGTWGSAGSQLYNVEFQNQPFAIAEGIFSRIQVRFGAKFCTNWGSKFEKTEHTKIPVKGIIFSMKEILVYTMDLKIVVMHA